MSNLIEHLGQDSLPPEIVEAFVNWCVWEQARPALLTILAKNHLDKDVAALETASTYFELMELSNQTGARLQAARASTAPLGISTAEAAAFIMSKLARAATEAEWDPEGLAFFAVQLCGWAGYAESHFTDPQRKQAAEAIAREAQETCLSSLWKNYTPPPS